MGADWTFFRNAGSSPIKLYYPGGTMSNEGSAEKFFSPNTLFTTAFIEDYGGVVDSLSIYRSNAGSAGSKARLGIYANIAGTQVLYPGALLADAGEIAVDGAISILQELTLGSPLTLVT